MFEYILAKMKTRLNCAVLQTGELLLEHMAYNREPVAMVFDLSGILFFVFCFCSNFDELLKWCGYTMDVMVLLIVWKLLGGFISDIV